MCGIFAAFDPKGGGLSEAKCLKAIGAVPHRGPDNLGYASDGRAFLGHTRLAIIGIDASGNQPFRFGDLSLVFNGEVFNYVELREELKALGYAFETQSDTEVVIKAYHEWGGGCFERFNGMWALVIYDRAKGTLTASRDRFGQKPMFLSRAEGVTYLASEFQQLAGFSSGDIDYGLIQMFLKEGGYDGLGRTFISTIEEFPKAHYCVFDASGLGECVRYWQYPSGPVKRTDDGALDEFDRLLKDSVRLRLRADVPVGILLSGGVDSTIVAAYCREINKGGGPLAAFTYASKDTYDEAGYAKQVADRLDLTLTVREQDMEPTEYRQRLRKLVRHLGRGHSSPAVVSIDYLYESVAKAGIRVALDGQGADELLAGYKNYYLLVIPWLLLRGRFRQAFLCAADFARTNFINASLIFLRNTLPPALKKLGRWLYGYERFFRAWEAPVPERLIGKAIPAARNRNALNRYLIRQHCLGLTNLLYYGDIVAMNNSVENRSPFLDHRLVDFAFGHDEKLKIWDARNKFALRRSAPYLAFKDVLERKKIGFNSSIRKNTKSFMVEELRGSPILKWPIFKPNLAGFVSSKRIESEKYEPFLFRLYQVHLWNGIFRP